MKKILVIIPVYNEEESIVSVIKELNEVAPEVDYVVINDCSTDSTVVQLKSIKANYIDVKINLGVGGVIQTGYKYAEENNYDIVIRLDGDGQHDPRYIEEIVQPILAGEADIVIGSRFISKEGFQSSWQRRLGIGWLRRLIYLCCGVKVKDVTSGFRAVDKLYISFYAKDYPVDYPEPEEIVHAALNGAKIVELPVVMRERVYGVSSINFIKSVYYMIKVTLAIIIYRISGHNRRKGCI